MSDRWKIIQGDALALLRDLPDGCVDAVVTDPPYSSGGFTRGDRTASTLTKYSDWRQLPTATDAIQAGGWVWRGISGMHKPDARPQGQRPVADLEFIVWGTKGASEIITGDGTGPRMWSGCTPRDREHQTQKPLDAMMPWVRLAPVGGLVLDPFAGSGTTGEAALLAGRRFLGFELTEHFATVACRRLSGIGHQGEQVSAAQPSLFGATDAR